MATLGETRPRPGGGAAAATSDYGIAHAKDREQPLKIACIHAATPMIAALALYCCGS